MTVNWLHIHLLFTLEISVSFDIYLGDFYVYWDFNLKVISSGMGVLSGTVTSLLTLYQECKDSGEDVRLVMETKNGNQLVTFNIKFDIGVKNTASTASVGIFETDSLRSRKEKISGYKSRNRFPVDFKDVKFNWIKIQNHVKEAKMMDWKNIAWRKMIKFECN